MFVRPRVRVGLHFIRGGIFVFGKRLFSPLYLCPCLFNLILRSFLVVFTVCFDMDSMEMSDLSYTLLLSLAQWATNIYT